MDVYFSLKGGDQKVYFLVRGHFIIADMDLFEVSNLILMSGTA